MASRLGDGTLAEWSRCGYSWRGHRAQLVLPISSRRLPRQDASHSQWRARKPESTSTAPRMRITKARCCANRPSRASEAVSAFSLSSILRRRESTAHLLEGRAARGIVSFSRHVGHGDGQSRERRLASFRPVSSSAVSRAFVPSREANLTFSRASRRTESRQDRRHNRRPIAIVMVPAKGRRGQI